MDPDTKKNMNMIVPKRHDPEKDIPAKAWTEKFNDKTIWLRFIRNQW